MAACDVVRHVRFIMSLLAMTLGLKFCMSRKGGTRGGGWVQPKGANSISMLGLACRMALVGTGRAISVLFDINGLRNEPSYLVGPPFFSSPWIVT